MRGGGGGGGGGGRFGGGGGPGGAMAGLTGGDRIASELGLKKGTSRVSLADFVSILRPYFLPAGAVQRARAVLCFLLLGVSKAMNVVAPIYIGAATDKLVRGQVPVFELVMFAVLRFLVTVADEGQRLVYLRVKEVAGHEVACRCFAHIHDLSFGWHVNKRSGVVLRAVDRGVASASTVVEMLFLRLIPTVIEGAVLVYIFAGAYGSPGSAAVLGACFLSYFASTYLLTTWRTKIRAKANLADNDAAAIANDSLIAFEVVKAFSAELFELKRYSEAVLRFQAATRQSQGSLVLLNILQSAIMRGALLGVLLVTGYDVVAGRASIGDFVALQTWVVQLFQPLSWLGSLYTMVLGAMTDMGNLALLLREEPDVKDAPEARVLGLADRQKGAAVEFRGVNFSYPVSRDRVEAQMDAQRETERRGQERRDGAGGLLQRLRRAVGLAPNRLDLGAGSADAPIPLGVDAVAVAVSPASSSSSSSSSSSPRLILDKVSFRIEPGKTLAVVGHTGSGKSTVARLLFRFFDANEGSVRVDGQDVREVTQTSLRAAIGIVPQDAVLFNESIRYNIAYGKPDATDEEIEEAARAAQIWPFITTLKEGLHTRVGERGLKLSGGEKQRVAIARTLLKNPPILVLDEATSALDSITEAEVQAALSKAREGRTVLVIAHRLSTVRDADQIAVFDGGRIVERGTHQELLAVEGGKYAQLWAQQSQMGAAAGAGAGAAEEAGQGTGAGTVKDGKKEGVDAAAGVDPKKQSPVA
jgi:ABC-type transport system involved in Fe-S cluster assembly fused permease/ATPase subunit